MNIVHEVLWSRLDLNLLRVFLAIWQQRSLAAVAEDLHLSPSAVSHALRRLRQQLGDELFLREGRRLVPSPRARQLAPLIQQHLGGLEQALSSAPRFDPARTPRRFVLGMREGLEPLLLPDLYRTLVTAGGGHFLHSRRLERDQISAELVQSRLDMVLDIAQKTDAGIERALLVREPLCVVMRRGHALGAALTIEAYQSAGHIQASGREEGPGAEDIALQRMGLGARQIVVRCQNYQAANLVVAQSELLLTMPMRLAQRLAQPFGNQIRMLPLGAQSLELYLYWRAWPRPDAAVHWLRDQILHRPAEASPPATPGPGGTLQ